MVGEQVSSLNDLLNKQVLKKASAIHSDCAHHLNSKYKLFPSGRRLSGTVAKRNRYKNTFILVSILALNANNRRR